MSRGTSQRILNLLDNSVRWTGIPDLVERPIRRRPLRWMSIVALACVVAGFVADLAQSNVWWTYALLMVGFMIANVMPMWGPIKPWGGQERADEFDKALRARAYLVAFRSLAAVALLGFWLTVGLSVFHDWNADALRWAIMKLAVLLEIIYSAGPTCYASWTQVPVRDDD